jgi:hypothetical protein
MNDLIEKYPENFKVEQYNHWLCGWVDRLTCRILKTEGEVTEKIEDGLLRKLKIKLPASTNLVGAVNGGATGYVTIKKTIIIAKGRVN